MSVNKTPGRGARRPTGIALWIVNALLGLDAGGLMRAGGFERPAAQRRQARDQVA